MNEADRPINAVATPRPQAASDAINTVTVDSTPKPSSGSMTIGHSPGDREQGADAPDLAMPGLKILDELGHGGMGVVYQGRDLDFNRTLAVKVLLDRHRGQLDLERRFLEEAQITAQLQHPGIAPVHTQGRLVDGRPYFSMKLIKGCTLAALFKERANSSEDLPRFLSIFAQVCQTLAYAHSRGVIHRDVKPANIMVGAFGEVQVMDWGLAKQVGSRQSAVGTQAISMDNDSSAAGAPNPNSPDATRIDSFAPNTASGAVVGTLFYMPPEQARGEPVDTRCDVFSLGAVLSEILTGQRPYAGSDTSVVLEKARQGDLAEAFARLDACEADADLIALAKHCLAASPDNRPGNAGQVAETVATYQTSVQERLERARVERAEADVRVREERKRRRLAMGLAAVVVTLVVGVGAAVLWYTRDQARREADTVARRSYLEREVSAALDEAERQRRELHRRLQDEREAPLLLSDPEVWRGLLESASAAWKRADRLAAGDHEMLGPELRNRLAPLAEQLQADESDRQLALALDKIRLESTNQVEGTIQLWRAALKLGKAFEDAGYEIERESAIQLAARIRQSRIRQPLVAGLDFWALVTRDEQLCARLLEVARRADPEPWRDRLRQMDAWRDSRRLIALANEVDYTAHSPQLLSALAQLLHLNGAGGEASNLLRRSLVHHPRDFWLFFELGHCSQNATEQAGAFRAALAVRPVSAYVYYGLGVVLYGERKLDEAEACYRKAIALEPKNPGAHTNLGLVLDDLQRPEEAIVHHRAAIEADPTNTAGYVNLGSALLAQRKFDEAIACYLLAIEINPRHSAAYNNLGSALRTQGKLDEAIGYFHMAVKIDPNNGLAWCNLGHTLQQQGKFAEALPSFRRGHEVGSRLRDWPHPSAKWVKEAEENLALDQKLTAVLNGEAMILSALEKLGFAESCLLHRSRYARAAQIYADAFAANPFLTLFPSSQRRYNAARAAALAAAGKGEDAANIDGKERARFRQQALDWLTADLGSWTQALDKNPAEMRPQVQQALASWQTNADLAGLRDKDAISKLPDAERGAWMKLWADVEELLQRAHERKK